jgi:putative transposase
VLPGFALHIVQRGINRNPCFLEAGDFAVYLTFLGTFALRFACPVHAYCLMTNHVHLLVTPSAMDSCALLMKNLGQCYVQWLNHRLGRSGTLWEGRFHSCMVNSDAYALACYRYIELNPVRAKMVAVPTEYRWSSYSHNACGTPSELITPHIAYEALGDDPGLRARSYRELCCDPLSASAIDEIRKATKIGCVVGMRRRAPGRPVGQMGKMGSVPI